MPLSIASSSGLPSVRHPDLKNRFHSIRQATERLCESLEIEDFGVQSMPDASPVKWHLAHTSWFFETFLLQPHQAGYEPFHPQFGFLFNSYYDAIGSRWPRAERGLMVRPTVAEVFRYRAHVDEQMDRLLLDESLQDHPLFAANLMLGLHHEQQHQELMLTDLKHAWTANPLHPVYRPARSKSSATPRPGWHESSGGLVRVGHDGPGFAFDNELPRHKVFLQPFRLATRLVTNGEYRDFIGDGGYDRPGLWMSDGWATRQSRHWAHPLYWRPEQNDWSIITLAGRRPLDPDEPVCHVSYYEADAFARWANARLPSEGEWEAAAAAVPIAGHFVEAGYFHPAAGCAAEDRGPLYQMFGDVWQWTASPYVAYPGYRPAEGALGEYNGKFMCNQFVLRGASCATPRTHARLTYRNFFPPDARWQFTGIRLAKEPA